MESNPGSSEIERGADRHAATQARLDELIDWYTNHARTQNWSYKGLKVVTIVAAAGVSVSAATSVQPLFVAALGALVVVVEGIQQLFQFHTNSVSFATTNQVLRRERALYVAKAGPYAPSATFATDPDRTLAERIEAVAARELEAWADTQLQEQAK